MARRGAELLGDIDSYKRDNYHLYAGAGMSIISIRIGTEEFAASPDLPFRFGRTDGDGVVGLDPTDMGISAEAGSVEFSWNLWWVVNRSRKRKLLLEVTAGSPPQRLDCGGRFPVMARSLAILVPGAIYTHRIELTLPEEAIAALQIDLTVSSGTITIGEVPLSERDKEALVAVCCGYLRPFPRRDPHPLSYQDAADLLGPPWTNVRVRKQIERLKERLARVGLYFEGPHANDELATHLIDAGLLSSDDLALLPQGTGR